MIKSNRLIAVAVAIAAVFCLVGCGDDHDNRNITTETQQPAASAETAAGSSEGTTGQSAQQDIGYDKVIEIVLAKVPGAAAGDIKEIEMEREHGRIEYEGELWYDGYEYEFEVDGSTGNIIKWEIDR